MSLNIMRDSLFVPYLKCRYFTKSDKMALMLFFSRRVLKHKFWAKKHFCNKDIFQIICLNYEIDIILKKKCFIIVLRTSSYVLYYSCKSKKSAYLDEAFKRY